jgi:hypothetical protein
LISAALVLLERGRHETDVGVGRFEVGIEVRPSIGVCTGEEVLVADFYIVDGVWFRMTVLGSLGTPSG